MKLLCHSFKNNLFYNLRIKPIILYVCRKHMIKLSITQEQIKRAKALYEFKILENSITKGKSNIFGALGEIVTHDYLVQQGKKCSLDGTYDYDLLIDDRVRLDVKSKRTTVEPKPHYNCSLPAYNTKQKCDYYLFCRIDEKMQNGYILGFIRKEDFFKKSHFNRKGESDGYSFEFTTDCYNLPIKKLEVNFQELT